MIRKGLPPRNAKSLENAGAYSVLGQKFELCWATDTDKQWLNGVMREMQRQRMNLQVMTEAKFVLLKANDKIIGWGGLDTRYNPKYPELFSLNLDPLYRSFSLGLLIETARATYLLSQNVRIAYVRMAKDKTFELLMKRLDSKFYELVDRRDLDLDYLKLCQRCDLLGNQCREQVFLRFNVEEYLKESVTEIGQIDIAGFPRQFELEPASVRTSSPQNNALRRAYKPHWL